MRTLRFKPEDRKSIDFAEEERLRFETGGEKDRAVVDASNLSEENIENWRDVVGRGKVLYDYELYNEGQLSGASPYQLYNTTINSPTDSVLVFFTFMDEFSIQTNKVKIKLGEQNSGNLLVHNTIGNSSYKSILYVFNNVPKNIDLTLSVTFEHQTTGTTIKLVTYNHPRLTAISI